MAYLNRFACIGRLVETPRMAATQNTGASVAHFTVAINRRYKRQDGNSVDETTFVDVEAWRGMADYCRNYLDKGMEIYCEGRLSIQKYTDQNNQPRERPIITLDALQLLSRTAAQEAQAAGQPVPQTAQPVANRNMPQPQMAPYQPPQQIQQQQQPLQRPPVPNYPAPAQMPPQQTAAMPPVQQPMQQQPMQQQPMPQANPAAPNQYADMGDLPF